MADPQGPVSHLSTAKEWARVGISISMTCPLNREVLEALVEIDILAALALTETSAINSQRSRNQRVNSLLKPLR